MADAITKAELKMLEKMFASEIEQACHHKSLPRCFQSKAKILDVMKDKGLVEPVEFTLGGRFPVTISGWVLTHLGRMSYCETC